MQFHDSFARKFYYLRLSITDVCNFRCTYCLPHGYQPNNKNNQFLSLHELRRVVSAFAQSGTTKVRITGGEPTLRKDFIDIVSMVAQQKGIEKIAVTTNGYRLAKEVKAWRDAGLTHINVSVDSLNPNMFHQITGENKFHQVMQGIDNAFDAGFEQVKINVVLMKGLNHQELPEFLQWIKNKPIQLRFIELMQTGEMNELFHQHHQSGVAIRNHLIANGWLMKARKCNDGPAEIFYHSDYVGEIGLIMPYSKDFCLSCNRLRISALGKLHLCLFGEHAVDLREFLQQDDQKEPLMNAIQSALNEKKQSHFLQQGNTGITPHLASIGG